jgi:hypothetical protein
MGKSSQEGKAGRIIWEKKRRQSHLRTQQMAKSFAERKHGKISWSKGQERKSFSKRKDGKIMWENEKIAKSSVKRQSGKIIWAKGRWQNHVRKEKMEEPSQNGKDGNVVEGKIGW